MLTLYHNDMSVCAAKVRTALAEKGLECNLIHLDLRAGDTQKPEYLKLNPNAVVPTLVHDDRVIIESTVICEYVDDEWSDPPLKPSDSFSRARMRLWTKQLDEGLHAAVGSLSFAIAFRHQWLARSAEDRDKWLAGIPQPDRRERVTSLLELGLEFALLSPGGETVCKAIRRLRDSARAWSVVSRAAFLAGRNRICALLGTPSSSRVRSPVRTPSSRRRMGEPSRTATGSGERS